MIVGVFLNSFKSYSQATYVPLCESDKYKFSTIIGKNGVGKSAILEALNFFFKQSSWNEYKGDKSSKSKMDKYVSPVFLIEKKYIHIWLENHEDHKRRSTEIISDMKQLSELIWESDDYFKGGAKKEHTESFIKTKNRLKKHYRKDYYLIVIGKDSECKVVSNPFTSALKSINKERINLIIESFYSYIYIPTDQAAHETLRIESMGMQKIMNRNVINKIEEFLNKKMKVENRNKSFIDHINNELNDFVLDINNVIKNVDGSYEFKPVPNQKQNIRPSDIMDNILSAYFTKRTLKVAQKEVNHLSSGEQRRAIIDVIYSFLINRGLEDKMHGRNIILAIDEPEISQDVSNCYEQFERLEQIANLLGNQVMLTTHWYGILPVIENGTLIHISEGSTFNTFDFYDYLDKTKQFREEIQMKSMYELAISLRNYLRVEKNKHLLICEGGTDKRYLETLINTDKVRIIPVGGIDNVRDIYNLLVMGQKYEKDSRGKKRILCLTDTDTNSRDNSGLIKDSTGKVSLRRLQINHTSNEVDLVCFTDRRTEIAHSITRIEDVLDVKTWIQVINEIVKVKEIDINGYKLLGNRTFSNLRGDTSILFSESPDASIGKDQLIQDLETYKGVMSKLYIKHFESKLLLGELETIPVFFQSLKEFFKEDILINSNLYNGKIGVIQRLQDVLVNKINHS